MEIRLGCVNPQEGAGDRPVKGLGAWAGMHAQQSLGLTPVSSKGCTQLAGLGGNELTA